MYARAGWLIGLLITILVFVYTDGIGFWTGLDIFLLLTIAGTVIGYLMDRRFDGSKKV